MSKGHNWAIQKYLEPVHIKAQTLVNIKHVQNLHRTLEQS